MEDRTFTLVRIAAPVRQQVHGALKAMIAEGHLAPGDRLIERDLCDYLGVSRPVLREALRHLEAEGLATSLPGRGLVVATLSAEDAREIYKVRAFLEGMAAQAFAETAGDDDVADLEARTREVEEALERGDALALRRAKNNFYETLVEHCGSGILVDMLRIIHGRIQLLRTVALSTPGRMQAATKEIRAICDAVAARQPETANALSLEHIHNAIAAMENALKELPSRVAPRRQSAAPFRARPRPRSRQ